MANYTKETQFKRDLLGTKVPSIIWDVIRSIYVYVSDR